MDFCLFIFPISKTISKNVTSRYSQEFLDHAKQPATDALKTTSRRAIQNTSDMVVLLLILLIMVIVIYLILTKK